MNPKRPARVFCMAMAICGSAFLNNSASGQIEDCQTPSLPIPDLTVVSDTIFFSQGNSVGEMEIDLDIQHTFINDLIITLASPEGTSVTLHSEQGGASDDIRVTFSDFGAPYGDFPLTCECPIQPQGPGQLADIAGEEIEGTWTLQIEDATGLDAGVLNEWCLRIYEFTVSPVVVLECTDTGGGVAQLTWTNTAVYDSIDIVVNGTVEATLPGSAESYTANPQPIGPTVSYRVVPVIAGGFPTASLCSVTFGSVPFVRGDCLPDGFIDIADLAALSLFSGVTHACPDACDINADGALSLPDLTALTSYLVSGGSLPAPFPDCSPDSSTFGCTQYNCGETPPPFLPQFAFGVEAPSEAESGDVINTTYRLSIQAAADPVLSVSFASCATDGLELLTLELAPSLQAIDSGMGPETVVLADQGSGEFVFSMLTGLNGMNPLATGTTHDLVLAQYGASGAGPSVESLSYCAFMGDPPVWPRVFTDTQQIGGPIANGANIDLVPTSFDFIRGDANVDGAVDLGDSIALLGFLFSGGVTPTCLEAVDVNDDLQVTIADAIYLLGFAFGGGPAPAAPYPTCGQDPNPSSSLGCENYPFCP